MGEGRARAQEQVPPPPPPRLINPKHCLPSAAQYCPLLRSLCGAAPPGNPQLWPPPPYTPQHKPTWHQFSSTQTWGTAGCRGCAAGGCTGSGQGRRGRRSVGRAGEQREDARPRAPPPPLPPPPPSAPPPRSALHAPVHGDVAPVANLLRKVGGVDDELGLQSGQGEQQGGRGEQVSELQGSQPAGAGQAPPPLLLLARARCQPCRRAPTLKKV